MPSITSSVVAQRPRGPAVDDRRHDEEDEDQRHDAAQHRPQIVDQERVHRRVAEPPVLRQSQQRQSPEHRYQSDAGQLQPALLFLRQRLQTLFRVLQVVCRPARIESAELGLDDLRRHQGADRGDHEGAHEHEQVVGGRLDLVRAARRVRGIDQTRGFRRDPGQQRVHRADQDVRGVAPRNAGKRGRQSDQRIPADGAEHHRRQGNQDHVPHLGGGVGDDRREHDDRGQQVARRAEHERPEQRAQQSGPFRHADSQESHQDRPQGREAGEVPSPGSSRCAAFPPG